MSSTGSPQALLAWAASSLQDPQARALASQVQWWDLPGLEDSPPQQWPVAVMGQGPTLLLLHGFDSSFLEFRRLAPLLCVDHTLVIPDLYGFGFTPRPQSGAYGPEGVLVHLAALLDLLPASVGLIGASMGGAVAMELARRRPEQIDRLLLLAPAGLGGQPRPLPSPVAALGVRFLSLPWVRRGLCRSAFADPANSVGAAELEIASLHLRSPGWADSLARFASSGGFAACGEPLPPQPIRVLWGEQDRVLGAPQRREAHALLGDSILPVPGCGHLPHLDQPALVRDQWSRAAVWPSSQARSPSPLPLQSHGPAA
ncbi:MAG: alpha/beta fold hydrolase [Cyanobacteriota bacterium]|jgi:pimeloyl-ACP methyl ester carboxylesterase